MTDSEKIQKLRDERDNAYIDEFDSEDRLIFSDWAPRDSFIYKSAYLSKLSQLYSFADCLNENKAVERAEEDIKEWQEVYFDLMDGTREDFILGNIHACDDFINGDDLFGENY